MRILVTGATGLVGRALVQRLLGRGHRPVALTRNSARARGLLGPEVELIGAAELGDNVGRCEAVINLAGESIFNGRWNQAHRAAIRDSRIKLTSALSEAIGRASRPPLVLVSASATGYYGDRGAQSLDDDSAPGDDFLARLSVDWEAAALAARNPSTRVFIPRIGIVLGLDGGVLAKLVPLFRMGGGGRLGSGRQFVPWIHIFDLVAIIERALEDPRLEGPMIAAAPEPVTNAQFTAALAAALGRPALLWVPALALRLTVGAPAAVMLGGQCARPRKLLESGLQFQYPELAGALHHLLRADQPEIRRLAAGEQTPEVAYLQQRPARYLLHQTATIERPLAEVFGFFSRAWNLGVMTPAAMGFEIVQAPAAIAAGAEIDYRLKVGPMPIKWRTRIERWEPERMFADSQARGPYSAWWHEHRFEQLAGHSPGTVQDGRPPLTVMEDRVYYAPPLGPAAGALNALLVGPSLGDIFRYRAQVMALRFPSSPAADGGRDKA